VTARVERTAGDIRQLVLIVRDTGAGVSIDDLRRRRLLGVGLANVERRLACQYGGGASLSIESVVNVGTTVEIRLPVRQPESAEVAVQRVAR